MNVLFQNVLNFANFPTGLFMTQLCVQKFNFSWLSLNCNMNYLSICFDINTLENIFVLLEGIIVLVEKVQSFFHITDRIILHYHK